MASRSQRQRIMAGAMNVLTPGDKLAQGESSQLDNWRIDQSGELRTRGAAVIETGAPEPFGDAGARYHSLKRTSNSRYSGVGTKLYWGPEPAGVKLIGSGYDGNPIGMAFYQGFGWAMNRGKQSRLSYDDPVHKWGVNQPAAAPIAAVGSPHTLSIEPFNGTTGLNHVEATADGINWEVEMDADIPEGGAIVAASFDTQVLLDPTASLELLASEACSMFVRQNFTPPLDSTFNGVANDDDTLYLDVYASDPTAIAAMTVRLSNVDANGNESLWVEANFKAGSAWDPAKILSQSPQSWTRVAIRRSLNVDQFQIEIAGQTGTNATALSSQLSQLLHQPILQIIAGGDPQILATNNTPGNPATAFDWTKVGRMAVSFVLSAASEVHLNDAIFVAAESASLTGSYQWLVSFVNHAGQDGDPSPLSNAIVLTNQGAALSGIPVDTDPDTTGRYIYRIGGSSSLALRVGTLFDNTATTWVDPTSDEAAQDNAIPMPIDRDLPPPGKGVIGPIYGKLHVFSSAQYPARLWWTRAGTPWGFFGALDPVIGDWEDVGQTDDEIVAISNHKTVEIIYKQRSIWRVNGDISLAGIDPVQTNANIGLVGENALCNAGAIDYFMGQEGVYLFNGDFEQKISQPLDPIFKGEFVRLSSGDFLPPIDKTNIGNSTLELIGDRLRVCYPEAGHTLPNVVAVCHVNAGPAVAGGWSAPAFSWVREKYDGLPSPAFTTMLNEGTGRYLVGGTTSADGARLYLLEAYQNLVADNGSPFTAIWQSRADDQNLPDNFKVYSDLEIDFKTAEDTPVSTLSVYLVFDKWVKVLLGTISSPTQITKTLRVPVDAIRAAQGALYGYRAKNAAVRIEGSIVALARIYGTYLHWYSEERTADTFDSGPTNFETPERCKEIDYVEAYVTGSGQQFTKALWSDLPGSVLVSRDTADLTAPSGRGNVRQRLTTPVDGRNFRLVLANDPTGPLFQIHQARMRGRVIGEYIDGTLNPPEYYESPEFSVAPGRVGELKDFLLDYDVSGPGGRLVVYSDLPGHALAVRTTLAIPYQSGRAPYVFPFENPAAFGASHDLPAGQLFKVRLYPPQGGILRLHGRAAFRARVIGIYFEGGNGEIWESADLDLLGGMGIFRQLMIDAETSGPMTLRMYTELPNQDMRVVSPGWTVDSSPTTQRQLPMYIRVPGNTKGHKQRFKLSGSATCRLYACRVLGRRLEVNGGAWDWKDCLSEGEATPTAWTQIQMPVRDTPEAFTWMELPVDTIE